MKRRYITLDAMRGVAALFVAARHFSDLYGPSTTHFSYLAVDIFFLLSGFVLSFSYGDKFAQGLTMREFLIRRIIRLYPLYLLGTVISFLVAWAGFSAVKLSFAGPGPVALAAISALLMVPSPTHNFSAFLFPFMIPAWSLFFELYVANLLFAAFSCRITDRWLLIVIISSLFLLLAGDWFYRSLDLGAQWHTLPGGIPRTLFSFFFGVLLQRWHRAHPPRLQIPSWLLIVFLAALLAAPVSGFAGRAFECACVVLFFPALVFWGAGARESHAGLGAALGDTSYALYVIHYPLIRLSDHLLDKMGVGANPGLELLFLVIVATFAYGLHHYFDEPLRAWLARCRARQTLRQIPA